MQQTSRSTSLLLRNLHHVRSFCTTSEEAISSEKIVAAVLFERLPLVVPKINPTYYAFQQFSFRWGKMGIVKKKEKEEEKKKTMTKKKQQQPDPKIEKLESLPKGDLELQFKRVPWTGNADESNNRRSLYRALDKRLYLLLYGCPPGCPSKKPIWYFPEKAYESEKSLRQCAELALKAVIGDISHACFVANAPMAHLTLQEKDSINNSEALKRFFFKSNVVGLNKFQVENCEDYVWVTRDELMEYFPEQADFLKKMIIC